MSTIIVTIGGTPTPGDLLILEYKHPIRGGNSALMYLVKPSVDVIVLDTATGQKSVVTTSDTIESIVDGFVAEFARGVQWPLAEFEVTKRNAASFVVKQKNPENFFDGIVFDCAVEGALGPDGRTRAPVTTETMTLEVL